MSEPLSDLLLRRLQERHDRPQITVLRRIGPSADLTGCDLHAAAIACIRRWRDWTGPGAHTLVLALPAGEPFLVGLLAGLLGGFTIVPVAVPRSGSQSDRLAHIVRDCGAAAVFCAEGMQDTILRHLTIDGAREAPCPVATPDGPFPSAPRRPSCAEGPRPAIIQYTSGSTRMPKGVRIFDTHILANCDLVARTWDMNPETRFVNWLPHYHDMGLMGGVLYPLLTGAFSVQMSPLDMIRKPSAWLRAISDFRATFSGGPAFAFADCLRRISPEECDGLDLSSWRRAFCGAEPIPAGLLDDFRDRFAPHGLDPRAVFACYGMAEATLYAAGAPEPAAGLPPAPAGCPGVHPCVLGDTTRANLRIVDPQTRRALPAGHSGEIWLRGPSVGQGYANLPEETAATFSAAIEGETGAEWLRTGDIGTVSDDLLYVTGRFKDTLIVAGRKISAAELEWLAATLDDALNPLAAAAFMPDLTQSAVAVLMIELKPGRALSADMDHIRAAIGRAVMGEWGIRLQEVCILPRGRLERTSSGKIRRHAVAEAYRRRGSAPMPMAGPAWAVREGGTGERASA